MKTSRQAMNKTEKPPTKNSYKMPKVRARKVSAPYLHAEFWWRYEEAKMLDDIRDYIDNWLAGHHTRKK